MAGKLMNTSIIAAMGQNLVIGTDTGLPWRLPADLKRFRRLTMGKPIIMGRKTLALLGKPLDGRCNIVLTRRRRLKFPGCLVAHYVQEAMDLAWEQAILMGANEVMVIGGGEIYRQTINVVTRLHLTIVKGNFEGNVTFPDRLPPGIWGMAEREICPADNANPHDHIFFRLEKTDILQDRFLFPFPSAFELAQLMDRVP